MRKYRTQEEVSWKEILGIIHKQQETSLRQTEWKLRQGWLKEKDISLKNLRASCACSRQLRRFLGRPETKMDRKAAELLESLDF